MTSVLGFDSSAAIPDVADGRLASRWPRPAFWSRAFSPSAGAPPLDASQQHALAECRALWDSGARHLVPAMTSPRRPCGSRAMGVADAMTFCHAIRNVYNWVDGLEVPSSVIVFAYLVQPCDRELSLAYWQGWASCVHSFPLGGRYPLYPALRCGARGVEGVCRTVHHASAPDCWALWATSPRADHAAGAWEPRRCANPFPATVLWQVAEDVELRVGINRTAPERQALHEMFVLLDRP